MTHSKLNILSKISFNLLCFLRQKKPEVTKNGLKIDIRFCENRAKLLFFTKVTIKGDSLLLTTKSLGVPGTILMNLTMKTPSGFKLVNPYLINW